MKPIVYVYLRIRPEGARYDLGDILVNGGAIITPAADLTTEVSIQVPKSLISDPMTLHAHVKSVNGPIRATLFAWSSFDQGPEERWERIAVGESADPIDLDGEFKPY